MPDFSNFKARLDVSDKTAVFYITAWQETPVPTLTLRPATQENSPYFNALMKRFSSPELQALSKTRGRTSEANKAAVAHLREIIPAHLVCDWSGVPDASGNEVPFSRGAANELFSQLPDFLVEEIHAFAQDRANFLRQGEEVADVHSLAGNSLAA